jgi:hypothetical protein
MRGKWLKAIRRFIELFTPGGTEYLKDRRTIHYSSNGTFSVPESEWKRFLFEYLDKSEAIRLQLQQHKAPFSPAIYGEFNPDRRRRIAQEARETPDGGDEPASIGIPAYALSSMGTNFTFSGPT